MYSPDDTIVAVATPPGRGGLGVIRLSGDRAHAIARSLTVGGRPLEPRHATLVRVRAPHDALDTPIDEAVATFFPAGGSYTGEDVVELSLHGSPVVLAEIVSAAVSGGGRLAARGEFTLRAFLNGRLDLTRAEAVQDLVEATTPAQARAAFDQLSGTLSEAIGEIEGRLFDLVARLEACADFPEEGYHFISAGETWNAIEEARGRIDQLLESSRRGRLLREGVSVAIVGRPNVGKSTLFNRLAGAERAIVTAVPGTTRDVLTESVMLLGTRMLLVDTAGLRATVDPVEIEGVSRAEKAGAAADVVVVVLDATGRPDEDDARVLARSAGRPRVIALNKSDLLGASRQEADDLVEIVKRMAAQADGDRVGGGDDDEGRRGAAAGAPVVCISARTGAGIDQLALAIGTAAGLGHTTENVMGTSARHADLLSHARECLVRAVEAPGELGQKPEEVVLSDLRGALEALQEVSGKRTNEDLLEAIFSKFCIGK
jgi:tRNA modification GTPase